MKNKILKIILILIVLTISIFSGLLIANRNIYFGNEEAESQEDNLFTIQFGDVCEYYKYHGKCTITSVHTEDKMPGLLLPTRIVKFTFNLSFLSKFKFMIENYTLLISDNIISIKSNIKNRIKSFMDGSEYERTVVYNRKDLFKKEAQYNLGLSFQDKEIKKGDVLDCIAFFEKKSPNIPICGSRHHIRYEFNYID